MMWIRIPQPCAAEHGQPEKEKKMAAALLEEEI